MGAGSGGRLGSELAPGIAIGVLGIDDVSVVKVGV